MLAEVLVGILFILLRVNLINFVISRAELPHCTRRRVKNSHHPKRFQFPSADT